MINWKKYGVDGLVLVAGSAVLSGVLLWRGSGGVALRVEDVAELRAGLVERAAWINLRGDEALTWPGVEKIGPHVVWAGVYSNVMVAARAMMMKPAGGVVWLDARAELPEHGAVAVGAAAVWRPVATNTAGSGSPRVYYEPVVTGRVDYLAACAQVHAGDGQAVWPGLATNRSPVAEAVYGEEAAAEVRGQAEADGWWMRVGNGGTNYQYACEQALGVTGARVYGDGIEGPRPGRLAAVWSNDTAVAGVRARAYDAALDWNYLAGVFEFRRAGLDAVYLPVVRLGGGTNNVMTTSTPVYELAEGGSVELQFSRLEPPPAVSNRFDFEVAWVSRSNSWGVVPYYYGQPERWHWWLPAADEANRKFKVTASNDVDGVDDVLVWRVTYQGQVNEFVIVQKDKDAHEVTLTPGVYETWGGATNSVTVKLLADGGMEPVTGRAVKGVDLRQAANVLTNLTRTMCVLAPGSLVPTGGLSGVVWTGDYRKRTNVNAYAVASGFDAGAEFDVGVSAAIGGAASEDAGTFDGVLCFLAASGVTEYDGTEFLPSHSKSGSDSLEVDAGVQWQVFGDCTLPYPCAAACASGRVARVTVYAALSALSGNAEYYRRYDMPGTNGVDETEYSYSATLAAVGACDGVFWGDGRWADPPTIDPERVPESGAGGAEYFFKTRADDEPLVLSLVAQEDDPVAPVVFSISGEPDVITAGDCPGRVVETFYQVSDLGGGESVVYTWGRDEMEFHREVRVRAWVVVVDWAFEHCDPAAAFAPGE